MGWIKRNKFFVIGLILALGMLGAAGFYDYQSWNRNDAAFAHLNETYGKLQDLTHKQPSPGNDKVDNIKAAIAMGHKAIAPAVGVAIVEVVVGAAMVEVGTLRKLVVAEGVWTLHVSRTAPLEDGAAVIRALDHYPLATVQAVMDVHAPLNVVHVARPAVGA